MYQEIFIEIGRANIHKIVAQESNEIVLEILLELMNVGCKKDTERFSEIFENRIKARYQTSFWREFLEKLDTLGSETFKYQRLRQLEPIILKLIACICKHLTLNNSDVFIDFNNFDTKDERFDEFFNNKRDLGKILRNTAKLVGVKAILPMLLEMLELSVSHA